MLILTTIDQDIGVKSEHKIFTGLTNILFLVPSFCGRYNEYLQAFEWMMMIYLIRFQKDKELGEIMYELNNSKSQK